MLRRLSEDTVEPENEMQLDLLDLELYKHNIEMGGEGGLPIMAGRSCRLRPLTCVGEFDLFFPPLVPAKGGR